MRLRDYQQNTVDGLWQFFRENSGGHPVAVLPTGAGKTLVIGEMVRACVRDWGKRVLVLAHVKELLQQAHDKIKLYDQRVPVGVYSAGLGRRDTREPCIVAGIQSVHKKMEHLGTFDLVIVDECHLIPIADGRYNDVIKLLQIQNPRVRVVGLTATPYRLDAGTITDGRGLFTHTAYEVGIQDLIDDGYLSPLRSKAALDINVPALDGVRKRGGEFVAGDLAEACGAENLVKSAVLEVVRHMECRRSCLIFAAGIEHGCTIVNSLETYHGVECGFVCGDTTSNERADLLSRFVGGDLKYLCNVNVLTTGFDAPNIDCVALLRPTLSPGLYYQMVGRGLRVSPKKTDCLVLDFGGNIVRHGPIDAIKAPKAPSFSGSGGNEAPGKMCPECREVVFCGSLVCPVCGFEFPPREANHDEYASDAAILAGDAVTTTTEYDVIDVEYTPWTKRGADATHPKTLRVDYIIGDVLTISEWVCVEHTGYAGDKAQRWWDEAGGTAMPSNAAHAAIAAGSLAKPARIVCATKDGSSFCEVKKRIFVDQKTLDYTDIPF